MRRQNSFKKVKFIIEPPLTSCSTGGYDLKNRPRGRGFCKQSSGRLDKSNLCDTLIIDVLLNVCVSSVLNQSAGKELCHAKEVNIFERYCSKV